MANEDNGNALDEPLQDENASGLDELLGSLGDAVRSKAGKDAISRLILAIADRVRDEPGLQEKLQRRGLRYSAGVGLILAIIIATLAWNGTISAESAVALLGSLMGYLFGRKQ
jgi:hypothetical protein